jgi:23S rRNA pseudouridine2604 synthase
VDQQAQRLSKVVAALVPCSRREAEQYIDEGWVRVDGQVVDEPQVRVAANQRVEVDPKARLQPVVAATFLLHKPAGVDMEAARELLAGARKSHLTGLRVLLPLPAPASGLCVFSQDFRVVRKLTEDAAFVEQELVADVKGTIAPDGLQRLGRAARVSWQSETRLRFAMKGVAPEAIAPMCAQVGLEVTALRRIRIGRVPMAGLPVGQWRYMPAGERF